MGFFELARIAQADDDGNRQVASLDAAGARAVGQPLGPAEPAERLCSPRSSAPDPETPWSASAADRVRGDGPAPGARHAAPTSTDSVAVSLSRWLRCTMRCMQRTNIYLTDEQRAALAERAATEDTTVAELVRRFIDNALAGGGEDLAADLAAIDASAGVLRDVQVDFDRADGARGAHLERLIQQ